MSATVEGKTTRSASGGWNLGYEPRRYDYALLRVDIVDWRVVEAWFVPMPVARRHARGQRHRLAARGDWQRERHTRRLDLSGSDERTPQNEWSFSTNPRIATAPPRLLALPHAERNGAKAT